MDTSIPTPSELLHSFLDGELDSSMETSLFSSLNDSPELRTEMRDMLALSRAVREDKVAMIPPIASTAAVFGALGMSTSMLVQSGWLSALWSKIWIPLAAGLVSSAITWYAVAPPSTATQTQQNSTPTLSQNATTGSSKGNQTAASQQASQQAAQSSSQESSSSTLASLRSATPASGAHNGTTLGNNSIVRIQHDTVYRTRTVTVYSKSPSNSDAGSVAQNNAVVRDHYIVDGGSHFTDDNPALHTTTSLNNAVSNANNNRTNTTSAVGNNQPADRIETEPNITTTFAALTLRKLNPQVLSQHADAVNASAAPEAALYQPPVFHPGFEGYVRALSGTSLVTVSVAADNTSTFNNVAVGVRRSFNEYFSAGLELGSESIAMKFSGVIDGSTKRYEANPALTWGAVFGQVSLFPSMWNSGWQPFAQVNLGGTNYGLLTKTILGVNIAPTAGLRLMVGAEGSALWYNVQNSPYRTFKIGYTYGIGYQF